jgi:hypothetical protein
LWEDGVLAKHYQSFKTEELMDIVTTVLDQMPDISRPHSKFMAELLRLFLYFRGKANFRNFSRYSIYCEKTFSRWFRKDFDFIGFNILLLKNILKKDFELVAAIDCSFVSKSGKASFGIGHFYNGSHSKAEKGLEISMLAIVDVAYNTAYQFSPQQTLPAAELENLTVNEHSKLTHYWRLKLTRLWSILFLFCFWCFGGLSIEPAPPRANSNRWRCGAGAVVKTGFRS